MKQDSSGRANVARVRATYEWMHLLVDFAAALLFVTGSVLFFYPSRMDAATWCFLIGSVFFAFKPTIRLISKLHQARIVKRIERGVERTVEEL